MTRRRTQIKMLSNDDGRRVVVLLPLLFVIYYGMLSTNDAFRCYGSIPNLCLAFRLTDGLLGTGDYTKEVT
jgi:hypothetical protein